MTAVSVGEVAPVLLPVALKRRADVLAAVLRADERADMTAARMAQWLARPVPVFYDVFALAERPYLLALGPALDALWRILGAPRVYLDGAPAEWHMDADEHKFDNLSTRFMVIKTPAGAAREVRFVWRDFEQTVAVRDNPWRDKAPEATLMTLQRDNPPEWIRDWCKYYHRIHGINRILIYNNKAEVEPALADCVAGIGGALEVEFTAWPFPYPFDYYPPGGGGAHAPDLYGFDKLACQAGALTHAYWRLGGRAPYLLNFDIDEYLVNKSGRPLPQLLAQRISRRRPALILRERPAIARRENSAEKPRVCDFRFFLKSPPQKAAQQKTICAASFCRSIIIHAVTLPGIVPPVTWRVLAGKENTAAAKILARAHRIPLFPRLDRAIRKTSNSIRRRIRRKYLQHFPGTSRGEWPDLYFNHYWGLTTAWEKENKRKDNAKNAPAEADAFTLARLEEAGIRRER